MKHPLEGPVLYRRDLVLVQYEDVDVGAVREGRHLVARWRYYDVAGGSVSRSLRPRGICIQFSFETDLDQLPVELIISIKYCIAVNANNSAIISHEKQRRIIVRPPPLLRLRHTTLYEFCKP